MPGEVLPPAVSPRVEEPGQLAGQWLQAREIRALVEVAVRTGRGEVRGVVAAFVLVGDDVLDLMADAQRRLREPALFAAMTGPPPHSSPLVIGHGEGFALASEARALD
jgi:hypothetical protein